MGKSKSSKRSLNVNVNHCKFKDAIFGVQELIANAVDANRHIRKAPRVEYIGNVLTIADSGRGLLNSDFILGESEGEMDTIGSFGAGLLDAVAVLMKHGCVLKAESHSSVFTFNKGPDSVIHLQEDIATSPERGTKWTIKGVFSHAKLQDARCNFVIFNPTKPFIRYGGLEVYNTRGEAGRLYVNGMRMNGVNPLCFHYNFTEKDTRKYGREHQVSNDLFNKELKILIAPIYQRFPDRFYDALQRADPKVRDNCDEKRWFMKDLFTMTVRPTSLVEYVEEPVVLPQQPPPRVAPKLTRERETYAIVDYDAAKQAGVLNMFAGYNHTIYVGTTVDGQVLQKKKRVYEIPARDPELVCATMVGLAFRYSCGHVTIHCEKSRQKTLSLALKAVDEPDVTVQPIPGTEKTRSAATEAAKSTPSSRSEPKPDACLPASEGGLQDMYKANKVGKLSVQGMKERLEQKWLKGIDCTVRLGGSLKKGVATRDSDVDMVVSVAPKDLAAAQQAVRTKALARGGNVGTRYFPRMHGQEGPFLAWLVIPELGKVDVVVTTPEKYISIETLDNELEWVAGVRQKHPHFKRAVVLLKVWKERNNLPLRGTAVENVAADACEASKSGTLPDVLCTALKRLATGKQRLKAKFNYKNDLAEDIKGNEWDDVVAAATAQLQVFEPRPLPRDGADS